MNELIEDYQRKINSVNELLKNKDNDKETINRLKIKVGCYRSFLTDLNRAFNIDDVSNQRELLIAYDEYWMGKENIKVVKGEYLKEIDEFLSNK
tara:strand:+ start:289 stop:570 length:282 start_codon:yes stop_codon:yes gene_type:complete